MEQYNNDEWWKEDSGKGIYPKTNFSSHYMSCRHWHEPVMVGRHIVTCSGQANAPKNLNDDPVKPDFGIYLAHQWQGILGYAWTNGSYIKRIAGLRAWPALVWDWPDMSTIPEPEIANLVEICVTKIRAGKQIEIGCVHGHGRTGTLLACLLARYEHLPGQEAVAEVRRRYCKSAVETADQERLVARYAASLERERGRNT